MPEGVPPFTVPTVPLDDLWLLVAGALGIALVSLTDTISTASAFSARSGDEVDGDREMVGVGAANLAAGLFQGFPVSTSGSRTAVAAQNGSQTQVTGLVGATAILLLLVLAPGLLRDLPQPTLAGVEHVVRISMPEGSAIVSASPQLERRAGVATFSGVRSAPLDLVLRFSVSPD